MIFNSSYLPSVGQRQMNCQTVLPIVFSGCMDLERTGDSAVLVHVHGPLLQVVCIKSSVWERGDRFTLPFDVVSASVPCFPLPTGKVRHKAGKLHVQNICDGPRLTQTLAVKLFFLSLIV